MRDLLDSVNGTILEQKYKKDSEERLIFSIVIHILTWIFLILISIGMLFYVYLFAINQTTQRQNVWFQSFRFWLLTEIFLISTFVVLITEVFVPLYSNSKIQQVKRNIISQLTKNNSSNDEENNNNNNINNGKSFIVEKKKEFNAAEFLYPSYRMTKLYIDYLLLNPNTSTNENKNKDLINELTAILKFKTIYPKKLLNSKNTNSVYKKYEKKYDLIIKPLTTLIIFLLSNILRLPQPLQEVVYKIFVVFCFGYIMKLYLYLYPVLHIFIYFFIIFFVIVFHFLLFSMKNTYKQRLNKVNEPNNSVNGGNSGNNNNNGNNISNISDSGNISNISNSSNLNNISQTNITNNENDNKNNNNIIDIVSDNDNDNDNSQVEEIRDVERAIKIEKDGQNNQNKMNQNKNDNNHNNQEDEKKEESNPLKGNNVNNNNNNNKNNNNNQTINDQLMISSQDNLTIEEFV